MPVYIRRTCSSLTLTQVDHSAISAASSMCACPSKSCLNGFDSEGCTDINKRRGDRRLRESHLVSSRRPIPCSYPNLAVVLLTITFKAPYLSQPVSDSGFICPRTTLPAPFLSAYRQYYTPTALHISVYRTRIRISVISIGSPRFSASRSLASVREPIKLPAPAPRPFSVSGSASDAICTLGNARPPRPLPGPSTKNLLPFANSRRSGREGETL